MAFSDLKRNTKLIFIGIGAVCLIIFLFQNFEMISFQFLFFHILVAPKWIVISITFLLGFVFGYIYAKKKIWAEARRNEPLV
jgi:uncharacterized integral membrane protein